MIGMHTNVLSAPMRQQPDTQVVAWLDNQHADSIWISSKAKAKLGWVPKITLAELVAEMALADYGSAQRDSLVKQAGFQAYDHHE